MILLSKCNRIRFCPFHCPDLHAKSAFHSIANREAKSMDKVEELCSRDKDILYKFSKLTLNRLSSISLLVRPLQIFKKRMDINVRKEVEKDRLIVEHASAAFHRGGEIGSAYVDKVFEKTKDVDREYIRKLSLPLLSIEVRYEDIAEIRKQRIGCLSQAVCSLLSAWDDPKSFEDAVRTTFSAGRFQETLSNILHLHNLEAMKLNRSIKLPPPFHRGVEAFTGALFEAMEESTKEVADGCVQKIYGAADDIHRR